MSASTDPLPLAAEFPPADREQWVALVAAVLAKAGRPDGDPVAELTTSTYDGIPVLPLYTDGPAPAARSATPDGATVTGWDVRTRHAAPDRAALLADLETGATSLWLVGPFDPAVLEGVYVDLAPIVLDAGPDTEAAAAAFADLVAARDLDPAEVRGSLGADPIGLRARTGAPADLDLLGRLPRLPELRTATVDATVYHDAGVADATELAVGTAVGVAYLRALTAAGLTDEQALAALEFRWAVTADQFASIAKLRAARRLWDRVAALSGASPDRGQRQHAVTSAAMMTRYDPWVNMLRTTVACFAAAVGGADAITVLPYDTAHGAPDELGRRIARNTSAILHDESSLGRVVDAAGGSWYVETLTDQLAHAAWDRFTEIERAGGALAALDSGLLSGWAAATRAARAEDIDHRRAPLTGVTEFALPDEPPVSRAPVPSLTGGPLPAHRWASEFEDLRAAVEATEPRPTVHLTTIGPPAVHAARLGFARNLFQAGGFRVEVGDPGPVSCLCSSDKAYTGEAVAALRADGADFVWVAGRGDWGADGYLYTGCDALAVLRRTAELLGVSG